MVTRPKKRQRDLKRTQLDLWDFIPSRRQFSFGRLMGYFTAIALILGLIRLLTWRIALSITLVLGGLILAGWCLQALKSMLDSDETIE